MGRSYHVVTGLEPPIVHFDERVVYLPRGRELWLRNTRFKLLLFLAGRLSLRIDGRDFCNISPGDALCVPDACEQVYRSLEKRAESRLHLVRIFFALPESTVETDGDNSVAAVAGDAEHSLVTFLREHFGRLRHLPAALTPPVRAALGEIRREAASRAPGFRHRVAGQLRLVVGHLGGGLPPGPAAEPLDREVVWVSRALDYLQSNLAESVSLDGLARHLRVSQEHIARIFRRRTGRTVFETLAALRVDRAKELLAGTQLPVFEIAHLCGYGSASLCCRHFRRLTGQTPAAYRRGLLQNSFYEPSFFVADAAGGR